MKFTFNIGGVETIFPESDVRYFPEKNKIVIYFSKINDKHLKKTEKNIRYSEVKIEENFLVLKIKDLQYAFDLSESPQLLTLYDNGALLGFGFENENGALLQFETPVFGL